MKLERSLWAAALLCLCGGPLGCLSERDDAGVVSDALDSTGTGEGTSDEGTTIDTSGTADSTGDTADTGEDTGEHRDPLVPAPTLPAGASCLVAAECLSRQCAARCDGESVCVPAQCTDDGDCAEASGDGWTSCCVSGQCRPVEGACGDRSGGMGDGCHAGGPSACQDGLECMAECLPSAYCAPVCQQDADCGDSAWHCYPTAGGASRCLPDPDLENACAKEAECGAGATCGLYYSFDGQSVVTKCGAGSGSSGGKVCSADEQCAMGICWTGPAQKGSCAAVCEGDADCACAGTGCRQQVCVPVVFSLGAAGAGAAPLCWEGRRCGGPDDCADLGAGAECAPSWRVTSVEELCLMPPNNPTALPPGAPCAQASDCKSERCSQGQCLPAVAAGGKCGSCGVNEPWCDWSCIGGWCLDGLCTSVCKDDAQCQALTSGTSCVRVGRKVEGGIDHSPICLQGVRCAAPSDCAGGQSCRGIDQGDDWATVCRKVPSLKGGLSNGAACADDGDCASVRCASDGTCQARLSHGKACTEGTDCESGLCSAAKCTAPCAQDSDCEAGTCANAVVPTATNATATLEVCVP